MPEGIVWGTSASPETARITPRRYYPPKAKTGESDRPYNPHDVSRWHPSMTTIPGFQGIVVRIDKYYGKHTLIVRLAHPNPFYDDIRVMSRRGKARWNDTFNTWDFPVLSQSVKSALQEIILRIEEFYFELLWDVPIELAWIWSITTKEIQWVRHRIRRINRCWGSDDLSAKPEIVYPHFLREVLEAKALEHLFVKLGKRFQPSTEQGLHQVCVNFLRHEHSPYELLLGKEDYIPLLAKIHRAIASAYPWLADEAIEQVNRKSR